MKKLACVLVLCLVCFISGCGGKNAAAKQFGGSQTVNLPKGQKLVNVTWKGDSLWVLTRPMRAAETPATSIFKENSNFGVWEGSVTIIESK